MRTLRGFEAVVAVAMAGVLLLAPPALQNYGLTTQHACIQSLGGGGLGEPPSSKADCRNGGWRNHGFASQGDCVAFVATAGKNEPGKNVPTPRET